MTRHRQNRLSIEDRILWNRVARTATPLRGKVLQPDSGPEPMALEKQKSSNADTVSSTLPAVQKSFAESRHIDRPTKDKLAKGRLPIEARVDLHGLTQAEAHTLLLSFLHRAHAAGLRHVLVITGKGNSVAGDGVLRRSVPGWFATAGFRGLVSGFDQASRRHGGEGAIYVRLRRLRANI